MPPHTSENPVGAFLIRFVLGILGWAFGAAILVGITFLSAVPYGGGTVLPLYLVVPWTVIVVVWVFRPIARTTMFAGPLRQLVVILAALGLIFGWLYWWLSSGDRQRVSEEEKFELQFAPHAEYFSKLCERAGPRVFKKVLDVNGIVVEGLRAAPSRDDLSDQNFIGDVYSGFDTNWDPESTFVHIFLTKREWDERWYVPTRNEFIKYPLVEIKSVQDAVGGFTQYTDASKGSEPKFVKQFVLRPTSSYLVRIEDISTPEDRKHWIAGSKWTIVDLRTGEILGESIAFAIDMLQGQTKFSGGFGNAGEPWAPWLRAGHVQYKRQKLPNACPEKDRYQKIINNLNFVRSVLVPIEQEMKVIPLERK